VEVEKGIGALFSGETYQKSILVCENAIILMIEHTAE